MRRLLSAVTIVAALALPASASAAVQTVYRSIPSTYPGNLPSVGVEAYSFNEIGDQVTLAGTKRHLSSVQVMLSSWACQSGDWTGQSGPCISDPGSTFTVPVTLRIYAAAVDGQNPGEVVPGQQLLQVTKTFSVPFRPTASNKCAGAPYNAPNKWYSRSLDACFNGKAATIRFANLGGQTLPSQVVWSVSYNSDNSGPNPIGGSGSPTDSLNVALAPTDLVGHLTTADTIFWDTRYHGFTCAAAPPDGNSGPFQTGAFNQDGPCDGANNSWQGYIPAATIKAS